MITEQLDSLVEQLDLVDSHSVGMTRRSWVRTFWQVF